MLAIFNKELVKSPQELKSPALSSTKKPKLPEEILNHFISSHSNNAFSMSCGNRALLAYAPPEKRFSINQSLIRQYGMSKGSNEAMLVIEAYRTLRDRSPYPADQVLRELDGTFAFVVYDSKAGTVFAALGANEGVNLYWGIAADGSVVISENLEVIKTSCAKSFAPFPAGCMFHSEHGLMSFEHPTKKMVAMPRIDSEGVMCGANFKVDAQSRIHSMPRVGSEANWATWGSHA
ncbi:hypothetical protein UlMin_017146 [Ulmus minor]